jgi:polysaccharide biosynthesis protein PslH
VRILFLSGWFPYPPDNGSKLRALNIIKQLARQHQVTLLSFGESAISAERLVAVQPWCETVQTVPYTEYHSTHWRALWGAFSAKPRYIVDTYSPQMAALVCETTARHAFDLTIAGELRTAPYARLCPTCRVFEDVELGVFWEQFATQEQMLLRVRYGLTWFKMARYIAGLVRQFDGCTVVSEGERTLLARTVAGYDSIAVVPNGIDPAQYTGSLGTPQPDTLIYSGALTYEANLDAVAFFLREIHPLIKAQRPGLQLAITGRTPPEALRCLPTQDGVTLTGYLPDVRPAIAQSWASIVPLRLGAGTRLKILEAMALGTPVVSTRKGAEGLEVTPGEDILIADTPTQFADAVLRLLGDAALRERLAAKGRALVAGRYNWDVIGQQMQQWLSQVIERRKSQ